MMDPPSGTFKPLPEDIVRDLADAKDLRQQQHILARLPKPTLYIGEVVEIKGVKFQVTRIKIDGKLGLRMLTIP